MDFSITRAHRLGPGFRDTQRRAWERQPRFPLYFSRLCLFFAYLFLALSQLEFEIWILVHWSLAVKKRLALVFHGISECSLAQWIRYCNREQGTTNGDFLCFFPVMFGLCAAQVLLLYLWSPWSYLFLRCITPSCLFLREIVFSIHTLCRHSSRRSRLEWRFKERRRFTEAFSAFIRHVSAWFLYVVVVRHCNEETNHEFQTIPLLFLVQFRCIISSCFDDALLTHWCITFQCI